MSVTSGRRRGTPITLAVTSADHDDLPADEVADRVLPPALAGVLGGLAAAAAGWLIMAGLVVGGWLTAQAGEFTDALHVATQAWLAGNGAGFIVAGTRWTVIPLGICLVFAVLIHAVAGFSARQRVAGNSAVTDRERVAAAHRAVFFVAVSYVLAVVVVALIFGTVEQVARGFIGSSVLAVAASWLGAYRGVKVRWLTRVPRPWPTVLRATGAGVGVLGLISLGVLIAAVITQFDRVQALTEALDAGPAGTVLLWVLQLAFLPNAIIWTGSWVLGAGFTFGIDTIVSPAHTDLGLLPTIPMLGALPSEGANVIGPWWWLLGGVAAGVVVAIWVVRQRPDARADETALLGGLAGVLAGLVFVAISLLSGGDLGIEHLVGVGPRLLELLVMAIGVLGISGLLAGLVIGLLRLRTALRERRHHQQLAALDSDLVVEQAHDDAKDADD